MKYIPAGLTTTLARQTLVLKKHSPVIMFSAGVTGTVVSAVMACRATLKFDELVTEAEKHKAEMELTGDTKPEVYSQDDLAKDLRLLRIQTFAKTAKLYAPAIGIGLVSVGLLTGSHVTLTRRNAAITAAYAVLDRGFNEYRERVRTELGDEKEREFRYGAQLKEIVEEGEHGHEVKTVKRIANNPNGYSIYARPFDKTNKHWSDHPGDNRNFVLLHQGWFNDKLRVNGHVFLNEIYDSLGLPRTKEGAIVGWVKDGKNKNGERVGDSFIDFGLTENNDRINYFMSGEEGAVWLDFNVDGIVYDLI